MSQEHWNSIYVGRAAESLGWYEPMPSTLSLVLGASTPSDGVIDVGGGTSSLAAQLVERGYRDVTVLDISDLAIDAARRALAQHAEVVHWIRADVTRFEPDRRWRLWHDRAVFHFLTDADDRAAYARAACAAVPAAGALVVATFGPDGPERCAGLPVARYDVDALGEQFAPGFELVAGGPLTPPSTAGDQRPYVAIVARRTGRARPAS